MGRGGAYCNEEERFGGMKLDCLNDPLNTLEGFLGRKNGAHQWTPLQLPLTCVLLFDSWWISTVVVVSVSTQHMYIHLSEGYQWCSPSANKVAI